MALPMLIGGGADCGPSNPLQGLSKRFDSDRGIQQDHFGAGRAGSSRETFRTTPQTSTPDADAIQFFRGGSSTPLSALQQHNSFPLDNYQLQQQYQAPFDVSGLRMALPSAVQSPAPQSQLAAGWAADFAMTPGIKGGDLGDHQQHNIQPQPQQHHPSSVGVSMQNMQWAPAMQNFRLNSTPTFMHQPQQPPVLQTNQISWDKEFSAQEMLASSSSTVAEHQTLGVQAEKEPYRQALLRAHHQNLSQQSTSPETQTLTSPTSHAPSDDLARTAALLLDTVKHEQNPKFQNSTFLGLMRQLRDGEVVVDGNKMVENDGSVSMQNPQTDMKGKGRAVDVAQGSYISRMANGQELLHPMNRDVFMNDAMDLSEATDQEQVTNQEVDETLAYFQQENADYTRYWNEMDSARISGSTAEHPETKAWGKLQTDWERFEATDTGIRKLDNYQFQTNNPYLLGDSSRTRNHVMHQRDAFLESVLELEATVQRDMTNASAWFELGVKQQENEREQKALQALQHAIDLDPTHLPTWLALAISHTNDNNRQGTYDAIAEWVGRNEHYGGTVQAFRAQNPGWNEPVERYTKMIECLIEMARSAGDVDADTQIALAVLLNTNEEYEKAQDCFRTALAVRPDDWLLYNRVGATMANSGQAEEALQYYYRALQLNPGYIRARFNLGISCINLRRYDEAAQHILDALMLQDSDGVRDADGMNEKRGVVSSALWDSLKTTCLHMQRADLARMCDQKDLEGFRASFLPE